MIDYVTAYYAEKLRAWALGVLVGIIVCLVLFFVLRSDAHAEEAAPKLSPTFLSAIAMYDADGRFSALAVGKTRFTSCKDALEDTQPALALAAEHGPKGSRAVGLCIPLHTYNVADLIPQ